MYLQCADITPPTHSVSNTDYMSQSVIWQNMLIYFEPEIENKA